MFTWNSEILKVIVRTVLIYLMTMLVCIPLYFVQNFFKKFNEKVCLGNNIKTIIVGDSRTRYGIDPESINNCVNISQDSQLPVHSYYVLKNILRQNPQVRYVVLSFPPNSLLAMRDAFIPEFIRRYKELLDSKYYSDVFRLEGYENIHLNRRSVEFLKLPVDLIYYYQRWRSIYQTREFRPPWLGEYARTDQSTIGNKNYLKSIFKSHFGNLDKRSSSALGNKYLKEIVQLCKSNNVKLILIYVPVHKQYLKGVPESLKQSHIQLLSSLKPEDAQYLDYSDLPLPDSCFFNYDHLNNKGAVVVSKLLNQTINSLKKSIGNNIIPDR